MKIRLLIGCLELNTTQGNIDQLYYNHWDISHLITNWWTRPYLRCSISLHEYHVKYNKYFESGQITAHTADQPIFALTKELMIRFPDKFGPDKYLFIWIPLHREVAVNHLWPGQKRWWIGWNYVYMWSVNCWSWFFSDS